MKKLVSLMLALALVLSLCGMASAAEDGKITIWTWDKNFNIKAMQVAKEMYQKDHPDVEINIEEVLSEDIETRVITAASADTKYLGITAQAESAKTAADAVKKSGNRAALADYETISSSANAITINANSADDQICTGAVTITVSDGSNGQTWQKNVTITNAGATISPGSKWKWSGGKAPELKANSLLVCKWAGVFGVLSLVTTE